MGASASEELRAGCTLVVNRLWMQQRVNIVKHLEGVATNKTAGSEQLAHKVNWTQDRIISEINISLQAKEDLSGSGNQHKHHNQHKSYGWERW